MSDSLESLRDLATKWLLRLLRGRPNWGWSVVHRQDEALPVEQMRDLFGGSRSIYEAARRNGAPPDELAKIEQVGKLLKNALDLASSKPGTVGHRAAWENAAEGVRRMAESSTSSPPPKAVARLAAEA